MRCMFYRGNRRPRNGLPVSRNAQPRSIAPPADSSFYGLDTEYNANSGMVPMKRSAGTPPGSAVIPQCPNLRTHGPVSPEEAVDNGTLYPQMFTPGAHYTYR